MSLCLMKHDRWVQIGLSLVLAVAQEAVWQVLGGRHTNLKFGMAISLLLLLIYIWIQHGLKIFGTYRRSTRGNHRNSSSSSSSLVIYSAPITKIKIRKSVHYICQFDKIVTKRWVLRFCLKLLKVGVCWSSSGSEFHARGGKNQWYWNKKNFLFLMMVLWFLGFHIES